MGEGVEVHLAALRSGDLPAKVRAVSELGKRADPRAVEPLLAALASLRFTDDTELALASMVALALGQQGDARAVPALARLLASAPGDDLSLEEAACIALSLIGGPEAAVALRQKFVAPDCELHPEVAEALTWIEKEACAPFFVEALRSPLAPARAAAASALGELLYEPAALPLQRLLRDPDEDVREAARAALEQVLDPAARELVLGPA